MKTVVESDASRSPEITITSLRPNAINQKPALTPNKTSAVLPLLISLAIHMSLKRNLRI
ncbi:hypothetical protein FX982_03820 [Pseudomonas graminis]|uniref:Uncharacterized protein n=1 Tax=Pseudomonas graminis TaxID=158627 RepID=A0A6M8MVG9_9PSED|nr:hypothetical protein FX982_03820 [Pseudomonas graminis]